MTCFPNKDTENLTSLVEMKFFGDFIPRGISIRPKVARLIKALKGRRSEALYFTLCDAEVT